MIFKIQTTNNFDEKDLTIGTSSKIIMGLFETFSLFKAAKGNHDKAMIVGHQWPKIIIKIK